MPGSTTLRRLTTALVTLTVTLAPMSGLVPADAASPPDAPQSVNAVLDGTDAVVSWQPPASDNGSPVTSYTVTSYSGDRVTVDGSTLQVRIHVQGGRYYQFKVVATNAAGDSPGANSPVIYVPPRAPDQPVIDTATPDDQQVTLHWTTQNNGSDITYTRLRAHPVGVADNSQDIVQQNPGANFMVTGLTNGTTYDFTVVVANDSGESQESAPFRATPLVPPLKNAKASSIPSDSGIPRLGMQWTASGYGESRVEVTTGPATPDFNPSATQTRDPYYQSGQLKPGQTYTITGWAMGYRGGHSVPTSFTFPGSVLAVSATPNPVYFGHTTNVTAHLTADGQPLSGQQLTLWNRMYSGSAWSQVGSTLTTDDNGVASVPIEEHLAYAQYQFRYAGTSTHLASLSSILTVEISPAITANVKRTSLTFGKTDVVWGSFEPDFSGSTMRLQELVHGTWRNRSVSATVQSQRLPDGSRQVGYELRVKPTTTGRHTYRAKWLGDSQHRPVYTSSVVVRVHAAA